MGITEEVGKVTGGAVEAMKGTPILLAILITIIGFLGFNIYLLGEVSSNARERNKAQMDLISSLVTDIRDCRAPRSQPQRYDPVTKSLLRIN
jgi:hypothetical protein